ncbi:MAG: hypothetical protein IKH24_08235, partial [Bacteroidales bacterium]|nr:hypothetical protein [Bacteroidales bacterium]
GRKEGRKELVVGAATIGVRRGAIIPRRTEPNRVSTVYEERIGFDLFLFFQSAPKNGYYKKMLGDECDYKIVFVFAIFVENETH